MAEIGTEEWAREVQRPFLPSGVWNKELRKTYKSPPGQCCASVWSGHSSHKCSRKSKVNYGTLEYCGQHDPAAVLRRNEARDNRYRAISEQNNRIYADRERKNALNASAVEAIRQIAAGHNDPRTLAIDVLNKAGEWQPLPLPPQ